MSEYVPARLRREIRQRASQHCEYCLRHEDDAILPHETDHIIATKHGGASEEANLAWTCFLCNRAKGSDIASVDSQTGEIVRLFSPRTDAWHEHFELQPDAIIRGKTPVGRATTSLLKFNQKQRIEIRQTLIAAGLYPPRHGVTESDAAES